MSQRSYHVAQGLRVWDTPPPPGVELTDYAEAANYRKHRALLVQSVLLAPEGVTCADLALQHNVSIDEIERIAIGAIHADILPLFPRRNLKRGDMPTCVKCKLYSGSETRPCSLGFPEAVAPKAATKCPAYYP